MIWTIAPNVAWQSIGGEVVLVDISRGVSLGLNPTGSFIWQHLRDGNEGVIVRSLRDEFQIDEVTARTDINEFLGSLHARGLIRRSSESSG